MFSGIAPKVSGVHRAGAMGCMRSQWLHHLVSCGHTSLVLPKKRQNRPELDTNVSWLVPNCLQRLWYQHLAAVQHLSWTIPAIVKLGVQTLWPSDIP